jgi:hypothetical protein
MKFYVPCPTKTEMEFCSNLITTMVNNDAPEEETKRVIVYSMTVIDANKMKLNWRDAKKYMGINELEKKYGTYMKQKMDREDIVGAENGKSLPGQTYRGA